MEHDNIKCEFAVMDAWKDNREDIKKWWFIDSTPQDIRYIYRNINSMYKEAVLQIAVYIEVEFNKEIFLDGYYHITDKKLVWIDVPYVE
jgi:hypothetical protein